MNCQQSRVLVRELEGTKVMSAIVTRVSLLKGSGSSLRIGGNVGGHNMLT